MTRKSFYLLILLFCFSPLAVLADELIWGSIKDGIRVGVSYYPTTRLPNCKISCVTSETTNYQQGYFLPPTSEQSIECTLKDSGGTQLEKTVAGAKFGSSPPLQLSRHQRVTGDLGKFSGDDRRQLALFEIDKIFKIKESGDYELQITPRFLHKEKNSFAVVKFDTIKIKLYLFANTDE